MISITIEEDIEKNIKLIESQPGDNEEEIKRPENSENGQSASAGLSLKSLTVSVMRLSKMASRKLGYASIEITEEDRQELEYALMPLEDYISQIFSYLVFAPLIIFAVGYTLGIYEEYKSKHPDKKKEIKAETSKVKDGGKN